MLLIQEKNFECQDIKYYIIITEALKEQFTQKVKFCNYLLTSSQMESHLKFYSRQIIPGASRQNSVFDTLRKLFCGMIINNRTLYFMR